MTSFDFQRTLSDGIVTLRPLAPQDWDALYAVGSDPLIWAGHPATDRWQQPNFRKFFDEAIAGAAAFAITRVDTGEIIGSSRYDRSRAQEGEVEIGWTFLARSEWGGATNRRVKRLMIAHALTHFDRVIFVVGEHNIRSRRAMEKIGGHLTDRTYTTPAGTNVIYAIDRERFAAGPLSNG